MSALNPIPGEGPAFAVPFPSAEGVCTLESARSAERELPASRIPESRIGAGPVDPRLGMAGILCVPAGNPVPGRSGVIDPCDHAI
jgi:hypothetical protein